MKIKNILVLLFISLMLTACQASDNDYKTMVIKNEVAVFSFEYRSYYHDKEGPEIVQQSDHMFIYVDILARTKKRTMANPEPGRKGNPVPMSYVPAFINVRVSNKLLMNSKYFMTASERITNSIESWSKWENFKLLEQSEVTVAGIEAELIAYEIDSIFSSWPLEYRVEIAFDYQGLCWDIEATNRDPDMNEILRKDIDHVLQTFKIFE
jgi:hypothetical protein